MNIAYSRYLQNALEHSTLTVRRSKAHTPS